MPERRTILALVGCAVLSLCNGCGGGSPTATMQRPWGDFEIASPGDCITDFRLRAPTIVSCTSEGAAFRVVDIWRLTPENADRRCPATTASSTTVPADPFDINVCLQPARPESTTPAAAAGG
jgi:hypothetical protein